MNARSNALKNLTWLFAVLLPRCAVAQIPEGWEIVEIFPAGTEYYCGRPDINDRGQIVFDRRLWPSYYDREIMLYDQGKLVQLTHDDVWDAFARINNHGEIVWQRDLDPDPDVWNLGIVRWRDGSIEIISEPPANFTNEGPDINDAGCIVWYTASFGISPFTANVSLFDGHSIIQIRNDGLSDQGPKINNANHVVWTRYDFSRSPWRSTIMLHDRGATFQISDTPGQWGWPYINDNGQAVWADSQRGLRQWSNGRVTEVVANNTIAPTLSDCEEISFSRWDTQNRNDALWLFIEESMIQLTDGEFGGLLVRQRYSGSRFEGSRDDEIPGRGVWRREHECGSDSILAAGVGCAVGGVSGLF